MQYQNPSRLLQSATSKSFESLPRAEGTEKDDKQLSACQLDTTLSCPVSNDCGSRGLIQAAFPIGSSLYVNITAITSKGRREPGIGGYNSILGHVNYCPHYGHSQRQLSRWGGIVKKRLKRKRNMLRVWTVCVLICVDMRVSRLLEMVSIKR